MIVNNCALDIIHGIMDRQKDRKNRNNRRFTCDGINISTNGRISHDEKGKFKRHNEKKKYDTSSSSYSMNWFPQSRLHPVSIRNQFSTPESTGCHYSVPLSFSFEPVSLPIYPTIVQSPRGCTFPTETESHFNRLKSYEKPKNRQFINKSNSLMQNDLPAMFHTLKLNNGNQQDYASLPPVNCDIYPPKSSDTEVLCKRRFSDPGIGQISSDDCSSIRSDDSNNSSDTAEVQNNDFYTLIEQINEIKENNNVIKKELNETKVELETFKMQSLTWKIGSEDFKPGALSDAISEIRHAVKLGEEALISKVIQMLERNSAECKDAQEKLEEKLRMEMNERLTKLEQQMQKSQQEFIESNQPPLEIPSDSIPKDSDAKQQIAELEREKVLLRKELQEAVAKRKTAEATTEKLERLVGILRKKINGVSLESCISDDKHILVRPLASSFEKNPFIIANNRQGQKCEQTTFSKPKVSSFRGFPSENTDGTNVLFENKENENSEANTGSANGNENASANYQPSEASSVTAQVTITGPVTDL